MKKVIFGLSLLLSFGTIACKKEGCTDSDATNFNEEANEDNGSCTYESGLVVWFNQMTAEGYVAQGVTKCDLYLEDELIGSIPIGDYTNIIPSCDGNTGFVTKMDLGTKKTGVEPHFSWRDNFGMLRSDVYFGGVEANGCKKFEIQ